MGMAEATVDELAPREAQAVVQRAQPAAAAVSVGQDASGPQRFEFTGSGSEYFRIWVVNLLLTIATLGIYSAWAKVRRLQYFYRNTRVADAVFDYHGNPKAILKGRILALVLLVAYNIASDLSIVAGIIVALVLMSVLPWLLARSFRFKMFNSTYRGVRFHFHGTVAQAYRMLALVPILLAFIGLFAWSVGTSLLRRPDPLTIMLTGVLMLLVLAGTVPLAHYLLKRYHHDNGYFGQTPFFFHARLIDFFRIYAKALGFFILGTIPAAIFGFLTGKVFTMLMETTFGWLFAMLYGVLSLYAFILLVQAYLESRVQNLVWNNTELGDMRFESTVSARKLLWIHASNLALIIVTLGLYKPFSVVRLTRYRVESMSLIPSGGLEEYLADHAADNAGAVGQEAGDLFDIDIAL
jgi:uncharacterized membrane protein YjgN (DUF898 family)